MWSFDLDFDTYSHLGFLGEYNWILLTITYLLKDTKFMHRSWLAKYYKTNERFHKKLCLPAFSPHFNIPIVSCEVHWQRYYGHCHELGLLGVLWICDHLKLLIFLHLIYSGAEFTEPVFLIDAKHNVETAGPSSSRLGEYSAAFPRATLYTIRSGDMT